MKRLVLLSYLIAWDCAGQGGPGDAFIWMNNYDANQPIFYFDGQTTQLAPVRTLVQVLARPLGSRGEFQALPYRSNPQITAFFVGPDVGFFDAGIGVVPGVRENESAEFVVRAWREASTWENALTNRFAFVGQSPIFTNRTGNYSHAANPAPLENFRSFTLYPFPEACRLVPFVGAKPLCVNVSANAQSLTITWADLGTNYVYTLESKPSLAATNWTPVPGTSWPALTNQFILPNPPAVPSFYRVRAQALQ